MLSKTKFLKTAVVAALIGLAGVATVTPASAREYDRHGSYDRDRDSGYGRDRDRDDRRGWVAMTATTAAGAIVITAITAGIDRPGFSRRTGRETGAQRCAPVLASTGIAAARAPTCSRRSGSPPAPRADRV